MSPRERVFQADPDAKPLFPAAYRGGACPRAVLRARVPLTGRLLALSWACDGQWHPTGCRPDRISRAPGPKTAAFLALLLWSAQLSIRLCRIREEGPASVQRGLPASWPAQPGHRALPGRLGRPHARPRALQAGARPFIGLPPVMGLQSPLQSMLSESSLSLCLSHCEVWPEQMDSMVRHGFCNAMGRSLP